MWGQKATQSINSQKYNPGNGRKAPYKSFNWAFLSTNTSLLPEDNMGNNRQWLFCSFDALPAERLILPLFLHTSVLERNDPENTVWCRKWDQPSSYTVLLADWPFLFFTSAPLCCLFTHRDFTNCSAMSPRGKRAENRMWIHLRWTNMLGETRIAVQVALTCLLDLRNLLKQEGSVFITSKQCFNLISLTSYYRTDEQLCLFAKCCIEKKLHVAGIRKFHLNTLKSFLSETAEQKNLNKSFFFKPASKTVKVIANCVSCQWMKLPAEVLKDYLTFRYSPEL